MFVYIILTSDCNFSVLRVEVVGLDEDGEEEGAAGGPETRRSLASLMDILRDLLRNIQLPDAPDRGDADVDSSGDDEPDNM